MWRMIKNYEVNINDDGKVTNCTKVDTNGYRVPAYPYVSYGQSGWWNAYGYLTYEALRKRIARGTAKIS